MLDDLEPTIHDTLMRVLVALFESGLVEEVDLGVVYRLFGAPPEAVEGQVVNFGDPQWIKDYLQFTNPDGENLNVKVINMETGEMSDGNLNMEELFEMLEEAEQMPERITAEDLSPDRKIH